VSRTTLDALVGSAKVIVCCGPGGVGKTSVAAAIALGAAERGRRTCVLTIDPARRLAQALGLDELDNTPKPVPGVAGTAGLDAMMLDMRRTFDDVVRRNAPSPEQAERILTNPIYGRLASSLGGTQEYMATEKLHELHSSGRWDLIVVDTPPTRSALDFLDAPRRLVELLDARLGMLSRPAARMGGFLRGLGLATTPITELVGRVTGTDLLQEMSRFLRSFEGMFDGFRERANKVQSLLHDDKTAFTVIATPDEAALFEAAFLAGRLAGDRLRLGAVIVNRVHQAARVAPVTPATRRKLAKGSPDEQLLAGLLGAHADLAALATAEQRRITGLLSSAPGAGTARVQVPVLTGELTDLPGLRRLGGHLFA
jgi:anion-transporting  ArsA/GET3 family ATPase